MKPGYLSSSCLTVGFFLLGSCASLISLAQDDMLSERDVLTEIPVVRIASRLPQPTNLAPASVTIIDRQLIEASGAQSWVDVFRLVPGFQSYSVNDNRPGISYHGFGSEFPNQLEVMVDGRSVYEPVFSTVIWNTLGIEIEDVDYIEIVRGPSASSHGSNAFLGAVNIVTRQPLQDAGTTIRATSGSRSASNASVRFNDSIGPLNYRVSAGYRHNNGFPSVPGVGGLDDGRELAQLSFRGTATPTLGDTLDLGFGYANDRIGLGDADHPDEFIDTDYYAGYQTVKWTHVLPSGNEFSLHAYHNSLRVNSSTEPGLISEFLGIPAAFVEPFLGIPDQLFSEGLGSLASERFDIEFEHQMRVAEHVRAVWGLGGRSEYTESELLQGRDDKIHEESVRGFIHSEWQPSSHWLVNAGAMIEKTFVGTLVSPRFSVSHRWARNHTLRMSVAQGKRAPSITEANLDHQSAIKGIPYNAIIRSDSRLAEERVTSFELGWTGYFPDWRVTADVKVFREQVRDGIDAFEESVVLPIPFFDHDIKVKANTAQWNTTGAEMQVVYRPVTRALLRLHYAYIDLDSDFVKRFEPVKVRGDFNDSQVRHSGGLVLNYQLTPSFDAGLTAYHQSAVNWRGGNFIDEYTRLDAQASYRVRLGNHTGKVQLVAQNVTGDYAEFNEENVFETRYYVAFSLDLP